MNTFLQGRAGRLEAALWLPEGDPRAAAVVCHPHPQHGGTMQNTVVFRTARGLQEAGLAVLRFNFRGVGRSQGEHDGGPGEVEDARVALDEMERRFGGLELWLAGFSFGARTAARLAMEDARVARTILVALPADAYDLSDLSELEGPGLVLSAGEDEFGTLASLRSKLPELESRFDLDEIPGVGHFFTGRTRDLQERVRAWAERNLALETA